MENTITLKIRFDGYYIFEPILYQERKEFSPDYLNRAFLFQKDGYVNIVTKWNKNKNQLLFHKKDFLPKKSLVKYINTKKDFYLHRYINKPWESKFYYDRISNEEFINRQTGTVMKFMPWPTTDDKEG